MTGQDLRRSRDCRPGWRRVRRGRGFVYLDSKGQRISSPRVLDRIHKMAIPPAYQDVWICPDPKGHLQYTGRDARGRKQYRYHARWRDFRDRRKFSRIRRLGIKLPSIRRQLSRDLKSPQSDRNRAIAMALLLLDITGLRIGSRTYLRENGTYGVTTLLRKHVRLQGQSILLDFRSKGGVKAQIEARNPTLVRALRKASGKTAPLLFYRTADGDHGIDASAVNARLRELARESVSAKDVRTWTANVRLLHLLRKRKEHGGRRSRLDRAIADVAATLGNTPAVCRRSYIDPLLIAAYESGTLDQAYPAKVGGLRIDERRYLSLCGAAA